MNHRRMGRSGLQISSISIGGWLTFGGSVADGDVAAIVKTAVDGGVNFIDLADVYSKGSAERVIGEVLAQHDRDSLVVSSKVFGRMGEGPNDRGLSRKHIMRSIGASLERLGTDYLDLYFCHRPDPDTPLEETVRAMDDLVTRGQVHYWGTSVWPAELLHEAHDLCDRRGYHPPMVEQPQYNLLERSVEASVLPAARLLGMGVVVWSPLAGGLLTGKYDEGVAPAGSRGAETSWLDEALSGDTPKRLAAFSEIARSLALKPSQLALAWLLRREEITSVITGATRPSQVEENLEAAEVELDDATVAKVEALFPAGGAA